MFCIQRDHIHLCIWPVCAHYDNSLSIWIQESRQTAPFRQGIPGNEWEPANGGMLFETAWMPNNCHAYRISHPEFVFTSCDQSVWKWEDQKRVFSPGLVWQITFLDWSSSSCSCLDKWLKTPSFPIATIILSRISVMTTFLYLLLHHIFVDCLWCYAGHWGYRRTYLYLSIQCSEREANIQLQ